MQEKLSFEFWILTFSHVGNMHCDCLGTRDSGREQRSWSAPLSAED